MNRLALAVLLTTIGSVNAQEFGPLIQQKTAPGLPRVWAPPTEPSAAAAPAPPAQVGVAQPPSISVTVDANPGQGGYADGGYVDSGLYDPVYGPYYRRDVLRDRSFHRGRR